jgi:hypothetical protein
LQRRNEDEVLLHPLNMIFFEKNSMDTEENNNRKCSLVSAESEKRKKEILQIYIHTSSIFLVQKLNLKVLDFSRYLNMKEL